VIVIQRVRIRWTAAARGAPDAIARRGLDRATVLPQPLPHADVVIREVLADQAVNYERRDEVLARGVDQARGIGLWLGRRARLRPHPPAPRQPGTCSHRRNPTRALEDRACSVTSTATTLVERDVDTSGYGAIVCAIMVSACPLMLPRRLYRRPVKTGRTGLQRRWFRWCGRR